MADDPVFSHFFDAVIKSNKEISTAFAKAVAELTRGFTPDIIRSVQDYLLKHGWYMAGSFTPQLVRGLYNMIQNGKTKDVDAMMIDYARERVTPVLLRIKEIWPKRQSIFDDAFNAHRQGVYTLSIPVFLSQSDGILSDMFGENNTIYNRNGNVPRTKDRYQDKLSLEQKSKSIDSNSIIYLAYFRQLEILSSVAYRTRDVHEKRKLDPEYNPLNRHGIMHGTDLNYDSESNSLKSILIIDYLEDIQEEFTI